jgi:hypothetical protein
MRLLIVIVPVLLILLFAGIVISQETGGGEPIECPWANINEVCNTHATESASTYAEASEKAWQACVAKKAACTYSSGNAFTSFRNQKAAECSDAGCVYKQKSYLNNFKQADCTYPKSNECSYGHDFVICSSWDAHYKLVATCTPPSEGKYKEIFD